MPIIRGQIYFCKFQWAIINSANKCFNIFNTGNATLFDSIIYVNEFREWFIQVLSYDEAKAILTTKMDAKIIDVYQFPYAVSEIIEAMNSIEEKFSTEKFLSMKEVTKCPPIIMNCIMLELVICDQLSMLNKGI